jgi:hypothetical protein
MGEKGKKNNARTRLTGSTVFLRLLFFQDYLNILNAF